MSPRREKLTSPQTRIALARGNRPAQHLLPIPGPVDTEAARRLFRLQQRTAVRTVVLLSVLLFGMSSAFAVFPALGEVRWAGVPVSWLMLMVMVYPALFGLALWHVRSAERAEERAAVRTDERSRTRTDPDTRHSPGTDRWTDERSRTRTDPETECSSEWDRWTDERSRTHTDPETGHSPGVNR